MFRPEAVAPRGLGLRSVSTLFLQSSELSGFRVSRWPDVPTRDRQLCGGKRAVRENAGPPLVTDTIEKLTRKNPLNIESDPS